MCNNAMIYNTAETIYFKAARKLQQTGAKIMSAVNYLATYRSPGSTYCKSPERPVVGGS